MKFLLTHAEAHWEDEVGGLLPGAHVVILASSLVPSVSVRARMMGLELRDTVLVLRPGPMVEFALLFRKPVSEPTVVQQILKTGTGGLHIDHCRIGVSTRTNASSPRVSRTTMARGMVKGTETEIHSHGRWPSNLVLVHGPGCQPGFARVEGHKGYPNGPKGTSSQFSQKGLPSTRTGSWAGYADADGLETVPAWECEPGCSVGLLDTMSGMLKSGDNAIRQKEWAGYGGGRGVTGIKEIAYGDSGGASRFFPQFRNEAELLAWFENLLTVHSPT